MPKIALRLLGVVVIGGTCVAQVNDIRQLERQRAEAVRAGSGLARFYSEDYRAINRSGAVTDRAAVDALTPDPKYTVADDLTVRMFDSGAITTGTQRVEDAGIVVRFLRVWAKQADGWTLVAFQGTAVASDTGYTAARSSVTTMPRPSPRGRIDRAVLAAEQSLLQAEAENQEAQARAFKTNDSTFVSRTGVPSGPNDATSVPLKTEMASWERVQSFGDIAVVQGNLLWTDVNGFSPGVLRFTRVWVNQGGAWKLAAEQRTSIGQ